jgi:hypothetical protein
MTRRDVGGSGPLNPCAVLAAVKDAMRRLPAMAYGHP